MSISPVAQRTIDNFARSEQTRSDIATAILSKQLNAEKLQGQAAVKLIEQAATTSSRTRGIDLKA